MRILLSGGGTMGSVSPLVAIYQQLKKVEPQTEVLLVGTKTGPEKEFAKKMELPYKAICSGKLDRYFSLRNFSAPFLIGWGFLQSIFILKKFKPDLILTAGSFVSVPLVKAAKLLKIPYWVHQQDLEIGLANKIMSKNAMKITVTFPEQLKQFDQKKVVLTSNPVRSEILLGNKEAGLKTFNLKADLKTVLIMGGGTGAKNINQLVWDSLENLTKKYQVIHLTGKGKALTLEARANYQPFEFLTAEMADALAVADLVVGRPGMSFLTEMAVLAKPSILILPANNPHQVINSQYFSSKNATVAVKETDLDGEQFYLLIDQILSNAADLRDLSNNIKGLIDPLAAQKYAQLVKEFVK